MLSVLLPPPCCSMIGGALIAATGVLSVLFAPLHPSSNSYEIGIARGARSAESSILHSLLYWGLGGWPQPVNRIRFVYSCLCVSERAKLRERVRGGGRHPCFPLLRPRPNVPFAGGTAKLKTKIWKEKKGEPENKKKTELFLLLPLPLPLHQPLPQLLPKKSCG